MQHRLPKDRRLRQSWEYQRVWKMGCKLHTPHFILLCRKNSDRCRLGITVSRKVGNAVQRNRIKRLIREFFRHHQDLFPEPIDLSVVGKKGAAALSTAQVFAELDHALLNKRTANG